MKAYKANDVVPGCVVEDMWGQIFLAIEVDRSIRTIVWVVLNGFNVSSIGVHQRKVYSKKKWNSCRGDLYKYLSNGWEETLRLESVDT